MSLSKIFHLYCGGQYPGENQRPVASHRQTLSHNVKRFIVFTDVKPVHGTRYNIMW
jgi:hypothetical protein